MINLSLKLMSQSHMQEKIPKLIQRVDFREITIFGGLLKKVTRKPFKITNPYVQIYFICKGSFSRKIFLS